MAVESTRGALTTPKAINSLDTHAQVDSGGLAPTAIPGRTHPAEIPLTLSKDVLRLPITMNARAVLAEIVSLHAANAGCCDASDTHFAARLTLNKDTVSVAVQLLETLGLVTKVTKLTADGNYRTLTPNLEAIAAKAATNPYPATAINPRRKFRSGQAGNSGQAKPEFPVMQAGNSGDPTPEKPESLTGISGGNIPYNTPVSFHTLNNDAADAALASEKKIEAGFSSLDLPADAVVSTPPVAAAPPAKPVGPRAGAYDPAALADNLRLPFASAKFRAAWVGYRTFREEQKHRRLTGGMMEQQQLNKLAELAGGGEAHALALIAQTIAKGWQDFYPLDKPHTSAYGSHNRRPAQATRFGATQPLSEGIQHGPPLTGSIDDL